LAGLAGNTFLAKMFQQFLEMKTLQIYLIENALNWTKPGRGTTSCLQSFVIFIMTQRSCFKQVITL